MDIKETDARYVLNTYGRQPETNLLISRGSGSQVWDEEGKEYLDLLTGLAVNALGHAHPRVVRAIQEQAETLLHTSNLYYTAPQAELAQVLSENSLKGKVFFANSGAEVNEAAIKMARKHGKSAHDKPAYKIVTARGSFHGRTLATITATGQPHHQKGFDPLVEGFVYAPFNDLPAFKEAVDEETCAVMVEPVQGEGGVHPADPAFLQNLRQLCDEKGILLIFDEIQCGLGRTGSLWAYEDYGVEPDILTSAKSLGGGLPLGAMICREEIASCLGPGEHASTFGGNPVACKAALAVWEELLQEEGRLIKEVAQKGEYIQEELRRIDSASPGLIKEVRGKGLMLAVEMQEKWAKPLHEDLQQKGFLVNSMGEQVIRILPPLTITQAEIDSFIRAFHESLNERSLTDRS